jgi:hypothetical protein
MKKLLILAMLTAASFSAFCQGNENDAVKKTIANMFDAMKAGDTVNMKNQLADKFLFYYVNPKKDTTGNIVVLNNSAFFKAVEAAEGGHLDERIVNYDDVNIGNGIAMVWASYKFYIGTKFHHCGVDVFHLLKTEHGWRVVSIFYTVKAGNCPD